MSYLTEAFKALDALNEETFDVSADGIKKLADFENLDDNVDETTIFDMDAETEDDIEDSYIGKVIIDCNVCHSKIYKDKDEVVIDDETNNANIDMECPYCYSTDGFKVIGEVAPMNTETEEKVEDDIKESLNEATTLQFTDDYEYDTLSAIEDDNITLFNKLKNYPELIKGDEVIIPKGTKIVYDSTDEYYKYYKLPEYGNLRIRILADEYTDFSHHIGTSDETFAKYVDKLNSGVRRFSVKWADVKDFEKYLKDHKISYATGYGGKASVPFIIKSKIKNESLNEATTDRVQNLLNIIDKSFEVSEDDFINEAVLDEDNKIRLSSIPGVTRDREGDFTDDGNRFQAYLYKGLIPITYLRSGSDVYISIAFHHLENINYEEYKEFPSYKHVDDFNGVSVANFDPQVFKKNLDAAYDDVTTFLGNVQEVDPQQLEDRIEVINKACKEYEEKVKQYIKDNALNIMKIPDYQFRQLKRYVISASNRTADAIRDASAASKRNFMSTDIEKLKERISSSWNFKYIEDILNSVKESFNEATVTDYKGSLSNILVKNKDKISKMATKGEIIKFLDSIIDEVRDKNYLETVKSNIQNKNDFGALHYIYSIILAGERKRVKESVTEGFKEEDESVNKDLLWAFRKLLREHPQTDIVFTSSYTKDGEIILEPTSYEDFDNLHLLKIDNALNSKDYQISTNKHLYILDKDAFIKNGKIHIPYEVEDPEEDPDDIDYVYKWDDDKNDKDNKLEVPGTTYSENDIRQKVYEIVTEDLDLDYDTIESTKQGNTVIVTVYGNEEEFEDEEVDSLVDELSEYLGNKAKVRAHINSNYDMVIKVILPNGMLVENKRVKESVTEGESANSDVTELGDGTYEYRSVWLPGVGDKKEVSIIYFNELKDDDTAKPVYDIEVTVDGHFLDETKLAKAIGCISNPYLTSFDYDSAIYWCEKISDYFKGLDSDNLTNELIDVGLNKNAAIKMFGEEASVKKIYNHSSQSLKESVKDFTITTDDSKTTMTSEDDGKVTVTTEPVEDEHFKDKEVIKPLDDETIQDIETNSIDDESEEDDNDEEETEFAENEFNESFSKLCENYLKKNYNNVKSFKATKSTRSPKQIIVEGLIKFTSGKVKNTKFSFNENISTKNHKGFQGKNLNITKDKAPFLLKTNSKMVCEALSYNYRTKNDENKKVRCKGIVKEG